MVANNTLYGCSQCFKMVSYLPDKLRLVGSGALKRLLEIGECHQTATQATANLHILTVSRPAPRTGMRPSVPLFPAGPRRFELGRLLQRHARRRAPPLPCVPMPHDVKPGSRKMAAHMIEARERRIKLFTGVFRKT